MAEKYSPDLKITIKDAETLKVIADPLRLKILRQLKQPKTVKEVGEALSTPPSKLYYHFSQLEKHALIRVVDTKLVSGIVEKHYQVAARQFKVDETLLSTPGEAAERIDSILGAIFDSAKQEITKSVEMGLMALGEENPCEQGTVLQAMMHPTKEQLRDFCSRLQPLLEECETWSEVDPGQAEQSYGLIVAFYPIAETNSDKSHG